MSQRLIESESESGTDQSEVRDPSDGVKNKLEDYTRRLSQLGLDLDSDSNSNSNSSSFMVEEAQKQKTVDHQLTKQGTPGGKITIRFQPIGAISAVRPAACKISAEQHFSAVVLFLKRRVKVDTVFCYISNSFAPSPQQQVGDLWRQFKVNDELIVCYCATVAFG
ncbi:Atg12p KNAG_0M00820 [Huiozyma naganishii CBS 8797]|uniref:Ubiquitin-like protein ATG12 n=1 Tax=Huiozyma naganishii (strain ATCC MYA-139 / BCRC 22969 / CBS 8797 / KCTC 17520 / NBRC 10181 / NCYC 3082 / Yp74L-3) TaxID=1071383 RepID=J7RDI1_HUIN7|nr:hypothetical protein KNAG_0M00820 [Kazachstania naganishii CBS 8797]CCK72935.1 hypothetical protein KNAG_0M00820 [Kazachstania naganishii CBS 8797]